ncbi:glycosyl hydrolase [candidate division KSB1 bacterium]|nr:glycosyl hydrolase [candidate division KSB1 bacterium]
MIIACLLLLLKTGAAQTFNWQPQSSGLNSSLRGCSAVDANLAWISGTNGKYARTLDRGKTWLADSVADAGALDFRDVQAFDASTAYLMSAGNGARSRIYKTTNSGKDWTLQFTMQDSAGFLDGFAFWDENNGIVFGDPIAGRVFILTTNDGGKTWQHLTTEHAPQVIEGEYAFAASGTSIVAHGKQHAWICTGGKAARVFHSADRGKTWSVASTPIVSGTQSSGIFSLAFRDEKHGIAVGGDYQKEKEVLANVARTSDGGKTWRLIANQTVPYRSCVAYVSHEGKFLLVAVGPSGSDYSLDEGLTWMKIGEVGYHTMSTGGTIESVWAAGAEGRVAKLEIK